jgi:hypothetical protein
MITSVNAIATDVEWAGTDSDLSRHFKSCVTNPPQLAFPYALFTLRVYLHALDLTILGVGYL